MSCAYTTVSSIGPCTTVSSPSPCGARCGRLDVGMPFQSRRDRLLVRAAGLPQGGRGKKFSKRTKIEWANKTFYSRLARG
eukprot:scaffold33421_cov30-Tisochrysis_lutea.AAC.1